MQPSNSKAVKGRKTKEATVYERWMRGVRESRVVLGLLQSPLDCSATLLISEVAEPNEVRALLGRQEKKLLLVDGVSWLPHSSRELESSH
jgi:hypothetical protein